jgi:AcrR family transcriptional regulator
VNRVLAQETSSPEIASKRLAVLEQAIAVFAEEGFRRADVQVIADRAAVGKGTVYRYFGNKEDLFWAAIFAVMERLEQHLFAAVDAASTPREKLRASGLAYASFFQSNPQYLEVIVQDRAEFRGKAPESHIEYHEKLIERFSQILADGIARGEFRAVDVRRTIRSLGSIFYGSMVFHCYSRDQRSLVESTADTLDIFLRGLDPASVQVKIEAVAANHGMSGECHTEQSLSQAREASGHA